MPQEGFNPNNPPHPILPFIFGPHNTPTPAPNYRSLPYIAAWVLAIDEDASRKPKPTTV